MIRYLSTLQDEIRPVDKTFERRLSYLMPELDNITSSDAFSIPRIIPIFPLPNVVLFPDTYLPLHIFEPRYRDMVADAGPEGGCIGMALFKEGWENDYEGNPPVFSLGCVGRIKKTQLLPDGRSNLILQGLQRYEIEEELFDAPYRKARITVRSCPPYDALMEDSVRSALVGLTIRYLQSREAHELCQLITNESLTASVLVNSLSSCLDFTTFDKQFLLESESLSQQARRLLDLLKFKLSDDAQPSGWG